MANGLTYLQSLELTANFPFISANIMDKDGNLLFRPFTISEHDGVKIAFIGLTSKFNHDDINIVTPLPALERVISDADELADYVVLLFHADEKDMKLLHKKDYPIDMVIQSKSTRRAKDGGTAKIPVFQCGSRGKYMYQLDFTIIDSNAPIVDISKYISVITTANNGLKRYRNRAKDIDLLEFYKNDSVSLQKINAAQKSMQNAESNINQAVNMITFEKFELDKNIIDRPDIEKLVNDALTEIDLLILE